ncbi:MAG: DNA-binding response regulator [Alphaproteobacteria bacterium CG11_big_fil_rev_8_21_14_0_20_39_49]|nr:MAG: DNA-binding response regulator [Alphaproteobacteria bacterium CG11_big_fil_rev_8_21_14_0_20_39_49]
MRTKHNTILLVDNELSTKKILSFFLDKETFKFTHSDVSQQAVRLCASIKPDIVLFEPQSSDTNSLDLITSIRQWSQVPIIIISEEADDGNIIKALNMGADDYIIRPFNIDVLFARIKVRLRKSAIAKAGNTHIKNGNIYMDLVSHEVFVNNKKARFTPKEYNLLRYFIINRGKMLSHKDILSEIWGSAHKEDVQYLRVFISQLRDKIEVTPSAPKVIVTDAGIGYRMQIAA